MAEGMPGNKSLFEAVVDHREGRPGLEDMLKVIANALIDNFLRGKATVRDRIAVRNDMVEHAMRSAERADIAKLRVASAFNFFTTTMLGELRQQWRSGQSYAELKRKMKEKTDGKTP